jgi:hypothetical protein
MSLTHRYLQVDHTGHRSARSALCFVVMNLRLQIADSDMLVFLEVLPLLFKIYSGEGADISRQISLKRSGTGSNSHSISQVAVYSQGAKTSL